MYHYWGNVLLKITCVDHLANHENQTTQLSVCSGTLEFSGFVQLHQAKTSAARVLGQLKCKSSGESFACSKVSDVLKSLV